MCQRLWHILTHSELWLKARYEVINATALSVHNTATNSLTGLNNTADGIAVIKNLTRPNQVHVYFPFSFGVPSPYNVWLTDYATFSLVLSCISFLEVKYESIWLLARTPTIDYGLLQKLLSFFRSKGEDISVFKETIQAGC